MSRLQRPEVQDHYELLFQTMPLGIVFHDASGGIVRANPAAARILGLSLDELKQRLPSDPAWRVRRADDGALVPSDQYPPMVALATGRLVQNVNLRVETPAGSGERLLCVSAVPVYRNSGEAPTQAYTIFEDITDRRAAERQARESDALFESVIERTPDPVFVKDRERRYRLVNPAASRILGHPADQIVGRRNDDLIGGDHARPLDESDERVLAGETVSDEFEWPMVGQTFNVVKFPHRDASGQVIGVVGLARDVTAVKRLERQLHEVHKLEAIGRLAGGIAHDFNNLLVVIGGSAALLEEQMAGNPAVADEIKELRAAADRAAGLTAQLLLLSRRRPVEVRSVDLGESLRALHQLLRRIVGEQIHLHLDVESRLPPVKIDPSHFEQIILNLIVNAKDAMPDGGSLYVSAKTIAGSAGSDPSSAGSSVAIGVRDTGGGIPADVLPHIFEPFFTTKGDKGTGLGLATSYSLTHQYEGTILVDSPPGRGTTFTVQLPASSQPVDRMQKNMKDPRGVEKILLVEDEPAVRRLSETILTRRGYEVIAAAGVENAVTAANDHPDLALVVTDLVLPDGSGATLVKRLRQDHPHMRVLFMSGHGEEEVVRFGGSASTPFIQKPFTPSELGRCIRAVLDDPSHACDECRESIGNPPTDSRSRGGSVH